MKFIKASQNDAEIFINIEKISIFYNSKSSVGYNSCIIVDSITYYVVDTVKEIINKINEANK